MDAISTQTLFTILAVLIVVSAYFSSSETGMMTINRYKLKHLANEGDPRALRVQKLIDRPDKLIGLILIGNNLANIAASLIAGIIASRYFGEFYGTIVTTFGLILVMLVFAEVTPNTLAALYPETISYLSHSLSYPLQAAHV